jgi:hypothetical protein
MSATAALRGSRVRRVASLGPRALCLELSSPKGVLVCSVERGAQGLGWVEHGTQREGLPPEPWVTTVRSLLEGAALVSFERAGVRLVRLGFARGDERLSLELEYSRGGAFAVLRHESETQYQVLVQIGRMQRERSEAFTHYDPASSLGELSADGARLVAALHAIVLAAHRNTLGKRLRTELERRKRRVVAIEQDRARVADAAKLRQQASLVLANLHALRSSSGEIELEDFTADPPQMVRLAIDPALGARAQADAWFQRARKLERGAELAKERQAVTEREISEIDALLERALAAQTIDALAPLIELARRFGVAPETATEPRKHKPAARVPYREFRGAGERAILVGRGAADNDALTLRHSKPHDLWLHVRDDSGAHVVVPLARNENCPPELLCDAATLAAHFSSARGADRADVIYTPRRYVQKPRKSAVGSVHVLREKVFRLQLEPARLKRLLASEIAT